MSSSSFSIGTTTTSSFVVVADTTVDYTYIIAMGASTEVACTLEAAYTLMEAFITD
jgi:hypothetical protein